MMEEERGALCGSKGVANPKRSGYRGGHTRSQVTLAGQRISISRPRARHIETGEVTLPSFEWATDRDPLDAATIAAIAAGVSTRRYRTTLDPLPADEAGRGFEECGLAPFRRLEQRAAGAMARIAVSNM